MNTIPVILLNYNSSADCRECVADLKRQEGVELDIVIVDNCSPREGEQNTIRQLCTDEGCTLIQAKENRGYNAGNNIGLRYAAEKGYKYALIANPDMRFPQTDYVTQLVKVMEEKPEVAVCGSDIVSPEGRHQNPQREATYCEELFWLFTTWRHRKTKEWFLCDFRKNDYCEKVSGCCLMVRMNFIISKGYFDENVFLYCEESILSKQVYRSGYKIYYSKDLCALHQHIEKAKGNVCKRLQITFSSRNYYYREWSGYHGLKLYILLVSKKIQQLIYKIIYV